MEVNNSTKKSKLDLLIIYQKQGDPLRSRRVFEEIKTIELELEECKEIKAQMFERVKELETERKKWIQKKEAMEMPQLIRSRSVSKQKKKERSNSMRKATQSNLIMGGMIHRKQSNVRDRSQKLIKKRSASFLDYTSKNDVSSSTHFTINSVAINQMNSFPRPNSVKKSKKLVLHDSLLNHQQYTSVNTKAPIKTSKTKDIDRYARIVSSSRESQKNNSEHLQNKIMDKIKEDKKLSQFQEDEAPPTQQLLTNDHENLARVDISDKEEEEKQQNYDSNGLDKSQHFRLVKRKESKQSLSKESISPNIKNRDWDAKNRELKVLLNRINRSNSSKKMQANENKNKEDKQRKQQRIHVTPPKVPVNNSRRMTPIFDDMEISSDLKSKPPTRRQKMGLMNLTPATPDSSSGNASKRISEVPDLLPSQHLEDNINKADSSEKRIEPFNVNTSSESKNDFNESTNIHEKSPEDQFQERLRKKMEARESQKRKSGKKDSIKYLSPTRRKNDNIEESEDTLISNISQRSSLQKIEDEKLTPVPVEPKNKSVKYFRRQNDSPPRRILNIAQDRPSNTNAPQTLYLPHKKNNAKKGIKPSDSEIELSSSRRKGSSTSSKSPPINKFKIFREKTKKFKQQLNLVDTFLKKYREKAIEQGTMDIYKVINVLIKDEPTFSDYLDNSEKRIIGKMKYFAKGYAKFWNIK